MVKKLLSALAEIRPEMLKALDIVGLSGLTRLLGVTWWSGTVSLGWHTGVVVPIFKKGGRKRFQARPSGRRPWGRPRTPWRNYISPDVGIPHDTSPEEVENIAGETDVWITLLSLLPLRPSPG